MKRLLSLMLSLSLLLSPMTLSAQDGTAILRTLRQLRSDYPTPMSQAQKAEMINRAAWLHRADDWGQLRKSSGNRCPHPSGVDVSCDYLIHRPTMNGYDVLVAEDTTAGIIERWPAGPSDEFSEQPERWVAPVGPMGGPLPPSPAPPSPPPTVPPVSSDTEALLALIGALEARLNELAQLEGARDERIFADLTAQIAALRTSLEAHRAEAREARNTVEKWLLGRIVPILGAIAAGLGLAR